MRTIHIEEASAEMRTLLEQAREEDLIVRLPDGSEFLVVAVDEFDDEIARTRQNPRLMALLEERARQSELITLGEVRRELGLGD